MGTVRWNEGKCHADRSSSPQAAYKVVRDASASLPYKSVTRFSVETAGAFNFDAELVVRCPSAIVLRRSMCGPPA